MLDPILVPTWLHFPSQKPQKSTPKSIPRGINVLIDFWMGFLSILARSWDPTWSHVGHFFAQNGGGFVRPPSFLLRWLFVSIFSRGTPGVPHRGAPKNRWGTPPGLGFSTIFSCILAAFSVPCWATLPHWLGWWGYAKRKELPGGNQPASEEANTSKGAFSRSSVAGSKSCSRTLLP